MDILIALFSSFYSEIHTSLSLVLWEYSQLLSKPSALEWMLLCSWATPDFQQFGPNSILPTSCPTGGCPVTDTLQSVHVQAPSTARQHTNSIVCRRHYHRNLRASKAASQGKSSQDSWCNVRQPADFQ